MHSVGQNCGSSVILFSWSSQNTRITEHTNHMSLHPPLAEGRQIAVEVPTCDWQPCPLRGSLTLEGYW